MTALDHARLVLAGIVPGRRDNLLRAIQHLEPEHFRNAEQRNLFTMLERYYDVAADIVPKHVLSDLLSRSGADAGKQLLYEEMYDDLMETTVSDGEFRYAIEALKDLRAFQLTGEAITSSFEILERGIEQEGREYRGHQDAREFLYAELAGIDRLGSADSAPEGDIRMEAKEILQDYADRKEGKHVGGIMTGIPILDAASSGFQNGELILICAYTGEGKSQLATQTAWDAAIKQGKNVFFATSETIRPQVRRRLLARHSRLPQFGRPDGLNSKDIKNGTLNPDEEDLYQEVVRDFTTNPTYGKMHVAQVPRGATLGFLEARLNRAQQAWNIDLVVIDYLALLKPDRKRQTQREEFNDVLKDAKVMATSHDGGKGVPIISPWAMSQSAYKEALRTGEYQLANLAETSEAEKSPDHIISLLRLPEQPNEVKVQQLKNRDGDTPSPFSLETDYRCAYLGLKRSDEGMEELLSDGSFGGTDALAGLL